MTKLHSSLLVIIISLVSVTNTPCSTVLQDRRTAAKAYNSKQWDKASKLYGELLALNPSDGALSINLGLALLRSAKYDEAIVAFSQSLETGRRPEECYYNMACAHALAGRNDQALDKLAKAYSVGYVNDELVRSDADLVSLHRDERFEKIVGLPNDDVTTRHEQWNSDLNSLARRFKEIHWRPFYHISENDFNNRLENIEAEVSVLTDDQIRAELQKLLASIGDGHTSIVSDFFLSRHGSNRRNETVKLLPIELFWFQDGVRVIAATDEYRGLIGSKVLKIDSLDIYSAIGLLDPYVSRDNEWGARWGIMQSLCDPRLLEAIGLGDSERGFAYEFETQKGQLKVVNIPTGGKEAFNRIRLDEALGLKTPLRYQNESQHLWLAPLDSTLYVRIDAIHDGHHESFATFSERIFETAQEHQSQTMIIDLRNNLGGQGHLTIPLLHRIIASELFNRPGGLYVMVGRKTFSAAMAFAAQLEFRTKARFVGEPTGSRPNFVGETSVIRLPYSDLLISISSRYHQNGYSFDRRFWIAPIIPARPDFAALRDGRDSALEAILKEMQ